MAHFYGSIWGSRGEATRMGDKGSGITGWVQSHHTRITSSLTHDRGERDRDSASITISAGHSNYSSGQLSLYFRDIDKFLDAINTSDTKVHKHVMRIRHSIQMIEDEAEGAIRRQKRRDKIKANREERERKAEEKRKAELRATITTEERRHYVTLVSGYLSDASNDDIDDRIMLGNPTERNEDGHLILRMTIRWDVAIYNLTTGEIIKAPSEDAA